MDGPQPTPSVPTNETPSPTKRLMISHMEMTNFKSYFGKQIVGPFHKCFSSVVGPNGSGKSNVIDAMLFVFGYRASKIRQGKLSGLIHNSEGHEDCRSCSVAVYFQDIIDKGDEFEVVPNSQVVVVREAKKDNTSSYTYNGKKITFKDLALELRKLGIDLDHNRFLILQGEVEAISMMPPMGKRNDKGEVIDEGMLEYLEDIIGSNQYIEPIKEMEFKLEELNGERSMKLGNVKIVEKEKDGLEKGKNEAEGFLEQENEITLKRSQLWQFYRHQCEENCGEASEKLKIAQEKLEESSKTLKEKEAMIEQQEKTHATDLNEYKTLKAARDEAKASFTVFERKDVQLRENDNHAKKKCKKLEKALSQQETDQSKTAADLSAEQDNVVRFEEEVKSLEANLVVQEKKLEAILEAGKGEKAVLKKELEKRLKEREPFKVSVNEAQSSYDIKKQEIDLLTSNARNVAAQQQEAKDNFDKAVATVSEKEADLAKLDERKGEAENELKEATTELKAVLGKEEPLVQVVKSKRAKLEETKSTANSARSQNKVMQTLTSLKRAGIYGRLGDLGAIADKFDCAITTACPQLSSLVVDTVATAQYCIDYLKKHNVGRVTCICLDKISHMESASNAAFDTPSGTDRLFDLVQIKNSIYRPAFYFALRNTLVASNLDTATKVAYAGKSAKHRVVTLEGQLIDTSGTMSGGGAKGRKGGMSSSIASEVATPQQIATLEKSLEKDCVDLDKHRGRRAHLEKTVSELKKELAAFAVNVRKLNMDITSANKVQPELKALIKELKQKAANVEQDGDKLAKLEKLLIADEKKLNKATAEAQKMEDAVQDVQKQIDAVGGVPLKSTKSKVKSLNSQIDTLRSSTTKAGVNIKTLKSKTKKLISKFEKDTIELTETKELRTQIRAELAEMDESAMEVMQKFEEAKQVLEEKETRMKDIAAEHKKLEDNANKLRSVVIDLEENAKTVKAVVRENKHKKKSWDSKINKLKLHKIGSDYFDDDEEDEEDAEDEDDNVDEGVEEPENVEAGVEVDQDGNENENDDMETNDDDESSKKPVVKKKKKKGKYTLEELSSEEFDSLDVATLEYDINVLEAKLGKSKPSLKAIKEYYDKEEEYIAKVGELDQVTEHRDQVRKDFEDLRKKRLDCFFAGFKIVSNKLKEMYQMITLGGDAELEYVDNINPFSEGIVFSVRPPRKSWKAIQNLSGGEKTLSSLALVFALHHFKPTPLYVMDEIDAALDFKNVSIVAHYIKERTKNAQFIIISLRNNMFELADRLVGIYKTDNCTKTVTINPHAIAAMANANPPSADSNTTATTKVHDAATTTASKPLSTVNTN